VNLWISRKNNVLTPSVPVRLLRTANTAAPIVKQQKTLRKSLAGAGIQVVQEKSQNRTSKRGHSLEGRQPPISSFETTRRILDDASAAFRLAQGRRPGRERPGWGFGFYFSPPATCTAIVAEYYRRFPELVRLGT